MEHAFSRIMAILAAALIFCIIPLTIQMRQQESMIQLSIMSDTVEFVDEIRNTGIITKNMYEEYQNKIRGFSGGLEVSMIHTVKSLHIGENGVERTKKLRTEQEITEALYEDAEYYFQKGDYLRMEVRREGETYVSYGGSIRYEN